MQFTLLLLLLKKWEWLSRRLVQNEIVHYVCHAWACRYAMCALCVVFVFISIFWLSCGCDGWRRHQQMVWWTFCSDSRSEMIKRQNAWHTNIYARTAAHPHSQTRRLKAWATTKHIKMEQKKIRYHHIQRRLTSETVFTSRACTCTPFRSVTIKCFTRGGTHSKPNRFPFFWLLLFIFVFAFYFI